MANLIFGGHKIGSSVLQFSAARGITSEIESTSKSVGISDGEMLINSRLKSRIIPVTYDFVALSRREFERQLAPLLYSTDVQKLIIDDRPDEFWYAKVDGKIDMDRAYFLGTGTINFLVPDGIAHSVATKTFDNKDPKWNGSPLNLLTGTSNQETSGTVDLNNWNAPSQHPNISVTPGQKFAYQIFITNDNTVDLTAGIDAFSGTTWKTTYFGNVIKAGTSGYSSVTFTIPSGADNIVTNAAKLVTRVPNAKTTVYWQEEKLSAGTTVSPWSPNPADPEYYTNTITVHNGGTYPVEPIITATMHADNGMVGIVNDRPGILQFGTQEIDGFTTEESEVALDLAAVQGSHMDNQAATNNPYWGGDPSMPNEQIGNAIWTEDSYDGWKVEPNWPSITGDHKYWNGPSIKHNLVQTHNGNFKSNLTWDVMTRFQTGVAQVGALETTLESDGKPIFQMILKDNSALSDQLWWMCYYKDQLVVNEQLDRSIFTNDKFIQLELQKFGNSVVFRVSPWVGNQGRETTITRQFTFADAASVETKQFSAWFMRDKTWGESTMYLIASTVKWQNVSWYTNIKNRFSNGDVLKIDVANAKTYLNGSLDPTMHTLGNQWEQFKLPPGDTEIAITPSSWAQPFACEVEIREAWL
ncbi:phage tail protein [Lacticaseibacillus rhamnosus]|uniref:distal tail protein Dit n=1 Tax=Lacticaseibacillus rhamnosus TaxID=47715 RepID=UPI00128F9165|nr:distal tail protein Dit [Lacticaseibacillus rhamnosus]QFV09391.1 phage tail protein [Lacticaseibacillus rhamnosus]QFV12028.1 phage tail protein [Lacticaseibacillus rhamnosus]